MFTEQILQALISERDRLNRAIDVLSGPTKRRGRPPKNELNLEARPATESTGNRTEAQRRAQSERMKAYWAKRRKER